MKKIITFVGFFAFGVMVYGQTESNKSTTLVEVTDQEILTSLKPEDAKPFVFASQADLDGSVPVKIQEIKAEILANKENAEKVIALRQKLWRLENAIVNTNK